MNTLLKKILRLAILTSLVGLSACANVGPAKNMSDYSYVPHASSGASSADELNIGDF